MTEYGVLALLLLGAVANYHKDRFALVPKNAKVDYFVAFVLTALYAASDEFHQTFVSGRSGQPLDVLIDSFGAIIFLIICYMIASFANKR
jgi:VanZ family protein